MKPKEVSYEEYMDIYGELDYKAWNLAHDHECSMSDFISDGHVTCVYGWGDTDKKVPKAFRYIPKTGVYELEHFLNIPCYDTQAKMHSRSCPMDWPICMASVHDGEKLRYYIDCHPIGKCHWKVCP